MTNVIYWVAWLTLMSLTVLAWTVGGAWQDIAKAGWFGLVGIIMSCMAKDAMRERNKNIEAKWKGKKE